MATINGTPGNDTLTGTSDNDQIRGFAGDDFLSGLAGDNDLFGGDGNDLLVGGPDYDYLRGEAGDDTMDGGGGDNEVAYDNSPGPVTVNLATGTASDGFGGTDTLGNIDRIRGSAFADRLTGNAGDNRFRPLAGDDTVIGGDGNDMVRYDRDARNGGTAGVFVDLQAGTATDGFGDTDTLISVERVMGDQGNDTLHGSAVANTVEGLDGDDLLSGGGGNDYIDGGNGADTVTYARDAGQGGTAAVSVDLGARVATDGFGNRDDLRNIENVIGTAGDDTLTGDGGANVLTGGEGDDDLIGGGGNDTLITGPGGGYVNGGDGNDRIDATADDTGFGAFIQPGLGADTILGSAALYQSGDGIDLSYSNLSGIGGVRITVGANGSGTAVSGTPGLVNDSFTFAQYFIGSQDGDSIRGADEPADSFRFEGFQGGVGNDTIDGGANGFDVLDYRNEARGHANPGGVTVNLATGTATDTFGNTDTVRNIEGVDGTAFADRMTAESGTPFAQFRGLEGNDTLTGATGMQTRADYSRDARDGGAAGISADLTTGVIRDGFGDFDTVSLINDVRGTAANDRIVGDGADNWLDGQGGDDTLIGGAGNDVLRDGAGNDVAQGGAGDDRFEAGGGEDTFQGGDGNDTIVFDLTGTAAGAFTVETDLTRGTNGAVGLPQGRDVLLSIENIELRGAIDAIFSGTTGANRLQSGSGNDVLRGDAGDDTLAGGDGADTLNGGDGDDVILGGETEADLRDVIYGGTGNDRIDAGHGNDQVFGGEGNDTVEGGFGVDEIIGQAGNDVLTGSAFSDLIFGGAGDDFVNGGFGSDRVNGGTGADRFYHLGIADHGSDWIQDYSAAEGDRLVWGGGAATRSQFQVNVTETANAGQAGVQEAFVIYRPTGQILWALVDGDAQGAINLQIGGQVFDLLA